MPESPPLSTILREAAAVVAVVMAGRNVDVAMAGVALSLRPAVQELAYGSLRQFGRGNFYLGHLLRTALPDRTVHALLLASLYRLELHSAEAHTTVNQAVEAAGSMAGGRFRALVNAVLRNFLRRREELVRDCQNNKEAHWQHPLWWIEKLAQSLPNDWEQALAAGNERPPMTLRVNQRRKNPVEYLAVLEGADIQAELLDACAIRLLRPVPVDRLPGFREGWVSVQDFGAQRAAELLSPGPGMRVLDACAAPGGKTAHLLESFDIELLALDSDAKRLERVRDNLHRLGLVSSLKAADCRNLESWWDGRPFDCILADVPCSASGVVRRHPDAKWLRRPLDAGQFAAVQREIIDVLWRVLAPGGTMLYATCSLFAEENTKQVADFLGRRQAATGIMDANLKFELQLIPTADHDGFFYAAIEKRS
jgi:16S rRNA (cytosine967-C5)-methyltransferase